MFNLYSFVYNVIMLVCVDLRGLYQLDETHHHGIEHISSEDLPLSANPTETPGPVSSRARLPVLDGGFVYMLLLSLSIWVGLGESGSFGLQLTVYRCLVLRENTWPCYAPG